jgi:thiol-disulfide isomerase/thioredoxin
MNMRAIVSAFAVVALLAVPVATAQATADADSDPLGLVGRPAPRIDGRLHLGPGIPSVGDLQGKVVLLFFWAHWCSECKAESAVIAKLLERYRSQGLMIIAPTQRYGYVAGGRPAPPDKELRYIARVRDSYYPFLDHEPVPVGEANAREYGANLIPLHVLIDRQGVVRFYHSGRMTEPELEDIIRSLL